MVQTLTATITVAIYLRLSRDDQNGGMESMSIANQREMLLNYCKEREWQIYDIYIDDGYTGTNFERPSFKRMIEDIEAGHINLVLTKDLSRLGRNYVMTGQYTDFFFPEHGVRFVAINDSYDSDKDDNNIAPFKNILTKCMPKTFRNNGITETIFAHIAAVGKNIGNNMNRKRFISQGFYSLFV